MNRPQFEVKELLHKNEELIVELMLQISRQPHTPFADDLTARIRDLLGYREDLHAKMMQYIDSKTGDLEKKNIERHFHNMKTCLDRLKKTLPPKDFIAIVQEYIPEETSN